MTIDFVMKLYDYNPQFGVREVVTPASWFNVNDPDDTVPYGPDNEIYAIQSSQRVSIQINPGSEETIILPANFEAATHDFETALVSRLQEARSCVQESSVPISVLYNGDVYRVVNDQFISPNGQTSPTLGPVD